MKTEEQSKSFSHTHTQTIARSLVLWTSIMEMMFFPFPTEILEKCFCLDHCYFLGGTFWMYTIHMLFGYLSYNSKTWQCEYWWKVCHLSLAVSWSFVLGLTSFNWKLDFTFLLHLSIRLLPFLRLESYRILSPRISVFFRTKTLIIFNYFTYDYETWQCQYWRRIQRPCKKSWLSLV